MLLFLICDLIINLTLTHYLIHGRLFLNFSFYSKWCHRFELSLGRDIWNANSRYWGTHLIWQISSEVIRFRLLNGNFWLVKFMLRMSWRDHSRNIWNDWWILCIKIRFFELWILLSIGLNILRTKILLSLCLIDSEWISLKFTRMRRLLVWSSLAWVALSNCILFILDCLARHC